MGAATISEDEYRSWLPPFAAVKILTDVGFDSGTVYASILYRVTAEDLRTVAAKLLISPGQGREETRRFELLAPAMWSTTAITSSFWDSGDAVFHKRHTRRGQDYAYGCTGIRFDPEGIERLADQRRIRSPSTAVFPIGALQSTADRTDALIEVPTVMTVGQAMASVAAVAPKPPKGNAPHRPASREAPKIGKLKLKEFVRDFATRNPGSSFAVILQNAKLKFEPQFRVTERPTKDVIADLGLTLDVGNPSILQKNRRIKDA
jgi:hypothetical protein